MNNGHHPGLVFMLVIAGMFISGCTTALQTTPELSSNAEIDWKTIPLTDVLSGESFSVSDFSGKTVFVESFAVWCPTCLAQQRELAKITEDTYVHVSLDTDPNEDEARVRSHLDAYGFDWRFAVADSQMTALLRDAFGLGVLSAPSAPVILVCPDQSAYFLQSGVKSASTLEAEALSQCGGV